MLEIIAIVFLLLISIFLAVINWKIYEVTVKMLEVTIDIHYKTIHLFNYTKKTYEVLGGEEGLTTSAESAKVIQMESPSPQEN